MDDRNVDEIPCKQKPCLGGRERNPAEPQEDVNAGLKGRPVLYTGVVWIGLVRRFLIPRTCVAQRPESKPCEAPASAPRVARVVAHVQDVDPGLHEPPLRYKQKSVPVPLVTEQLDDADGDSKAALLRRPSDHEESSTSPLRALVVQVHEVSAAAAAQARAITHDVGAILRDGQDTTAEVIESVRSEDGERFRLAAISASGLVGYLAGLRRGVVARLVFSATGATAMATVCYPEDTKTYNRQGLATVRRWMVLGLSVVHGGINKPLGKGDMREVKHKKSIGEETDDSNTEQPQTNALEAENIISNLMQNLGSLSYHFEDIKAKLKLSGSKTDANDSIRENCTIVVNPEDTDNSTTIPPQERTIELETDRIEKLPSINETKATKNLASSSVPYSPALPVPPKSNSSQSKLIYTPRKTEENLANNYSKETTSMKRKKSNDHFRLQAADELTGGEDDEDGDLQEDEDEDDFSERTFVIPTGGLEEKLEGRQENLRKVGCNRNDGKPLNKKLTVYYKNMPEEEKTSREKGYKDAYSNRGK